MSTPSIQDTVFHSITNAVFSDPCSQTNMTAVKAETCFLCRRCSRQFQSKQNLRQHMWCLSEEQVNAAAGKANQQTGANPTTTQFRQFIGWNTRSDLSPPLYWGPSRDHLLRVIEHFYPFKVPS